MTIEEKVELVKNDIQTRFPGCSYTVKILLWDDGTDSVSCQHGTEEKVFVSTYYNNELKFEEKLDLLKTPSIIEDEEGTEYTVHFRKLKKKKIK